MEILDNVSRLLGDDLKKTIEPGARLRVAASCFSIYAFEALKAELEKVESLQFIFTSPTFVPGEQGTIELKALNLSGAFDHPKPLELVKRCLQLASTGDDLIVDFFGGASTTAHAVLAQNADDGARRRFILVQWPEDTGAETEANLRTIADVGKERIRRAGRQIRSDLVNVSSDLDVGFRVLKVDTSNMKDVYYTPDSIKQDDLLSYTDNIKEDRTAEDLLFQVLVDWGLDLTLPVEQQTIAGKPVFLVDGNALAACFENQRGADLQAAEPRHGSEGAVTAGGNS